MARDHIVTAHSKQSSCKKGSHTGKAASASNLVLACCCLLLCSRMSYDEASEGDLDLRELGQGGFLQRVALER
jgi:hypothetical protein